MSRQVETYPVNVNDISSLPALNVNCDQQTDTASDGQRSGQMNEEKLRRLELIRAAAEGRK